MSGTDQPKTAGCINIPPCMPTESQRWSVTADRTEFGKRAYTGDISGAERPYSITNTEEKKHDKDLEDKIGISPHYLNDCRELDGQDNLDISSKIRQ